MTPNYSLIPPKILFHNANNYGGGHYRILLPAQILRHSNYAVTQATMQMLPDDHLEVMQPDSVVFQHLHTPAQADAVARYKKILKGACLIYEIDDIFWEIPEASAHYEMMPKDIKAQITRVASMCSAITVTTPELANVIRSATKMRDVRVVPNQLPKQFLNSAIRAARDKRAARSSNEPGKIRIGWAGGIGHTGDLALVTEIMATMPDPDRFQWVFMGMSPEHIDRAHIEYHEPVAFANYATALGNLDLDIALAPLADNLFNRCKSDLRVLEYGACGYMVIASDLTPYDSCPVERVSFSAAAWINAIELMAREPHTRYRAAEELHQYVAHQRLMEHHVNAYAKAYTARNAVPFVPNLIPESGKLVTVGGRVGDLANHATLAEAWTQSPGADILYVRPGTFVPPEVAVGMSPVQASTASVSAMSNDGFFPQQGSFTPVNPDTAQRLREAAAVAAAEPGEHPFPYGPCVLLCAVALSRFGLPDEARFSATDMALIEWGARTAERGCRHLVALDTYIATSERSEATPEGTQAATQHTVSWTPPFLQALQTFQASSPFKEARANLDLVYHGLNYTFPLPDQSYADWWKIFDTISSADREAMEADFEIWQSEEDEPDTPPSLPLISVVMPVHNPAENFLAIAIESVLRQTYPNWQLCIADDASTSSLVRKLLDAYAADDPRIKVIYRETNGHICAASNSALELANGDLVCFLDHDDVLAEHALYMVAREARLHPEAQFLYSDSDKLNTTGARIDPYFTPDWNYELLLGQNYVTHLAVYRLAGVKRIGGFQLGYEGSQDWDLTLRYLDAECGPVPFTGKVRHIPHVLYHWRQSETSTAANIGAKPYALKAGHDAVRDHLGRIGVTAMIGPNPHLPIFNLVRFLPPGGTNPMVSIIIPTRDNPTILQNCIGSIIQRTEYASYEILVVDNGSHTQATLRLLAELQRNSTIRVLRHPGPFNYSTINNAAVAVARGEFVCLLNDDTEILEPGWLHDMVGAASRKHIGAVGPKLIYPNNTVQECGIIFNPKSAPLMSALHAFQRLPYNHPGHFGRAVLPQEFLAVTGACLLIRRELYLKFGGLDESFAQDYNDVEFCLRLYRAGYRNVVVPQIVVRHHEGHSKRANASPDIWRQVNMDAARLCEMYADIVDPAQNPNMLPSPTLDRLCIPPPAKPWHRDNPDRVLIINGGKDDAIKALHRSEIAFCATLDGHFLSLTYPSMRNVEPFDLRDTPELLSAALIKLGVTKIVFSGIGGGTIGAVGYLTQAANTGWPVEFRPNGAARGENPNDYVDPAGWRATWDAFDLATQGRRSQSLGQNFATPGTDYITMPSS